MAHEFYSRSQVYPSCSNTCMRVIHHTVAQLELFYMHSFIKTAICLSLLHIVWTYETLEAYLCV